MVSLYNDYTISDGHAQGEILTEISQNNLTEPAGQKMKKGLDK